MAEAAGMALAMLLYQALSATVKIIIMITVSFRFRY